MSWIKNVFLNDDERANLKSFQLGNISTAAQYAQALQGAGSQMGEFDYSKNVKEAYAKNPVAYFGINLKADLAAQPRPEVWLNDKLVEHGSAGELQGLLNMIERPNANMNWAALIAQYFRYMDLAGETFMWRMPDEGAIKRGNGELSLIEPSSVTIKNGEYHIKNKNSILQDTIIPISDKNDRREILHRANWHPNSNRGLSALTPAWLAISNHNKGQEWNHALLDNSARLGLVVLLKSVAKGQALTPEQIDEVNRAFGKFTGSKNAGKTITMQGDWEVNEVGQTQKDLDWNDMLNAEARMICWALNVPPILLGLPGDSSYSNVREAYVGLMKFSILPQLNLFKADFEMWMKEIFPGDWTLRFNLDDIAALEPVREALWERQEKASDILTKNERRELLGYAEMTPEQEDELSVSTPTVVEPVVESNNEEEINGEDD